MDAVYTAVKLNITT